MSGKKEKVFELILEIGHKATLLPKKPPSGYTHKWTVFVKGHNNSKIEHCIQRVVFQLHESFDKPFRDINEPPYQIKETGYAGFEIPIQVYFKNRDKPNHVVFVHDLCLLANKPNDSKTIEKIKFINPNKEFEKCLIKSGAQLLPVAIKKEPRSSSPPAKKQKSSSLIPSKDMYNKQSQPQTQSHSQSNQTQQHQSSQSNHHHHNHHQHHHRTHYNHHHTVQQQQDQQKHQQQAQQQQKPKPTEFIDIFGPPLVKSHGTVDELQNLQNKISNLSDGDRLQKIVDIIEEAGDWFNLTPKKFEFDLKRLDKKTLSKIERIIR